MIIFTIFVIPCSSFITIMICQYTYRSLFCIGDCSVNTSLQLHVLFSVLNVSYSESLSGIYVTYLYIILLIFSFYIFTAFTNSKNLHARQIFTKSYS